MSKHRTARFREKQMDFLPVKMNVSGIANVPLTLPQTLPQTLSRQDAL